MRENLSKILVTGGAGFIGSEFVRQSVKLGCKIAVIDKLDYAGDLERLKEMNGNYKFYKADICKKTKVCEVFSKARPDVVVNFAAQTHVDRSIIDATPFIETNVKGTQTLLDASMKFEVKRFIQISTDEVYGEIKSGKFPEEAPMNPSSPYAASKAAADLLIKSYIRTYGFPAIIIRPSNNYGHWQYPEKLIPLTILKILKKQKVPVYADGKNVREWLYVGDCARGVLKILNEGKTGEVYNLGSNEELQNIELVKTMLRILKAKESLIQFVKDRPGHDFRYRIDSGKVRKEIGWKPKTKFEDGIKLTIHWSLSHKNWLLGKWRDVAKFYKAR